MQQIQILGDSHGKRLGYYIEKLSRRPHAQIFCPNNFSFSGAGISDLKANWKKSRPSFNSNVPLLVCLPCNDLLAGTELSIIKSKFLSLLRLIRRQYPGIKLLLTQLPIFPRCRTMPKTLSEIKAFNIFLSTLENQNTFIVPLDRHVGNEHFIQFYPRSAKKDELHLNDLGNGIFLRLLFSILTNIR